MTDKEKFVNSILSGITVLDDSEINDIQKALESSKKAGREISFRDMVPKRYRNVNFEGDPKLLTAHRSVIYGPYGTGKTYLGYSIAKELFVQGAVQDFQIVREREMYNAILNYQKDPKNLPKPNYNNVGLLIIDEYGKNSNTDASASHIFNIIDYRYDWELRTILICNAQDGNELKKIVPEAVQDRFVGSTHLMSGESRREAE
jgi:DNA replication protein DnaC